MISGSAKAMRGSSVALQFYFFFPGRGQAMGSGTQNLRTPLGGWGSYSRGEKGEENDGSTSSINFELFSNFLVGHDDFLSVMNFFLNCCMLIFVI